ncbi:hypothetical protein TWF694_003001 [Orbilia ellipsospora]|uniref:Carboxylesterase type B domain-containing protein n=1 Tax=Orbilia ellipsospora TaxID=2528407 RepID=A0AAV9X1G3_9PEZI
MGEIVGSEMIPRDESDVPFEQLIVDYWSSFIWTGNPNPKTGYLQARGYWGTLSQIQQTGKWDALNTREEMMRLLEWNGGMVELSEAEQCTAIGYPIDYYESNLLTY